MDFNKKISFFSLTLITIFFLSSTLGYSKQKKNIIQIKGSDTMVNLVQAWAERYMEKNPEVFIAVTGGGSGTGIASFISGTCDIAVSSRQMKEREKEIARQRGMQPYEIVVALDGLAVVVNPSNPIDRLTIPELRDIFTGKVTNWSQVGGKDEKIVVLSREVNSGTHIYFKEHVLKKDENNFEEFSSSALLLPSSQAICDEVAQNKQAIGYYGMGYLNPKNKAVAVAVDKNSEYYLPTEKNIISGKYPISRPLFFYVNGTHQETVKDFLDFVLSDEGQLIVKKTDFVPIRKLDVQD